MSTKSTSSTEVKEVDVTKTVHDQLASDGTLHQSELGPPKRKHFFSPLDSAWAEAVHRDAETVQYTPEEEVRLRIS
jgi:hypothetical protein